MNNQLEAALLVAVLSGAGFYLCTSRRLLRVMFGFFIFSNAVNLVLLGVSGDPGTRGAPVVRDGVTVASVDPLPQALILTAIVIGFAVAAYLAVLVYRIYTDRHAATVPTIFDRTPGKGSPAARELAADDERRRLEVLEVNRRRAEAARHDAHGHADGGKGGHS